MRVKRDADEPVTYEVPAPPDPAAARQPVEHWRDAKGHTGRDAWRYAATFAGERWVRGQELTEAEYDAAVARVTTREHA